MLRPFPKGMILFLGKGSCKPGGRTVKDFSLMKWCMLRNSKRGKQGVRFCVLTKRGVVLGVLRRKGCLMPLKVSGKRTAMCCLVWILRNLMVMILKV